MKALTKTELAELKASLKKEISRDSTLLELALFTGARASELLAIRRQDLNTETKSVLIQGLKGSNQREIPLKPALFKRLEALPGDLLFPIGYQRLNQIWQAWRPYSAKNKGIHSLRHCRAIELYDKTRDLLFVKRVLGHKALSSTMVYSDYIHGQSEMRRLL